VLLPLLSTVILGLPLAPPDGVGTFIPGILELLEPTTRSHAGLDPATGERGETAIIRAEKLLLVDPGTFPISSAHIFLDFGTVHQELVEYSSRDGRALVFDEKKEFEYQHPLTAAPFWTDIEPEIDPALGVSECIVLLANLGGTYGLDGFDHPVYLPGDPTRSIEAIVDHIRPAGIKVVVIVEDASPMCDPC